MFYLFYSFCGNIHPAFHLLRKYFFAGCSYQNVPDGVKEEARVYGFHEKLSTKQFNNVFSLWKQQFLDVVVNLTFFYSHISLKLGYIYFSHFRPKFCKNSSELAYPIIGSGQ